MRGIIPAAVLGLTMTLTACSSDSLMGPDAASPAVSKTTNSRIVPKQRQRDVADEAPDRIFRKYAVDATCLSADAAPDRIFRSRDAAPDRIFRKYSAGQLDCTPVLTDDAGEADTSGTPGRIFRSR